MTVEEKDRVLAKARQALAWLLEEGGYKRQHADCLWEALGTAENGVTFASLGITSNELAARIANCTNGDTAFEREFRTNWPQALRYGMPEHSATVTSLCG